MRNLFLGGVLVASALSMSACSRDVTRGAGFGALGGAAAGALAGRAIDRGSSSRRCR